MKQRNINISHLCFSKNVDNHELPAAPPHCDRHGHGNYELHSKVIPPPLLFYIKKINDWKNFTAKKEIIVRLLQFRISESE